MEPKFQTSFIPKKPIVNDIGVEVRVVRDTNVISLIGNIFFIATLVALGGLYAGKMIVRNQIDTAKTEIKKESEAFQLDKVNELIDNNSRIVAAKNLVDKHVAVSPLLSLVESLTVKRMRLLGLVYSNKAGVPTLNLTAEALNYNVLAEQSRIFKESTYMSNNQFSNFVLEDNGYIKVDFATAIDTNLVTYKKAIESMTSSTPTQ